MKASPAPSTLNTSTGKPGAHRPSSGESGMAPSKAVQPCSPRFITISAALHSRMRRSACTVSPLPPAMCTSSSVPTSKSHSGSTDWICVLTSAEGT